MEIGTVKFFNNLHNKQFGFIRPDQEGQDVFFQRGLLVEFDSERLEPRKGDRVAFLSIDESNGPRAWIVMWKTDYDSMPPSNVMDEAKSLGYFQSESISVV